MPILPSKIKCQWLPWTPRLFATFLLHYHYNFQRRMLSILSLYRFVWRKKIERDVSQGQKVNISVKSEKKKQQERMVLWNTISISIFISWNKAYHSLLTYFQWINKVHSIICIILFSSMLLYCSALYALLPRKLVIWSSSKRKLKIMLFLQRLIVIVALSNVGWNRKG